MAYVDGNLAGNVGVELKGADDRLALDLDGREQEEAVGVELRGAALAAARSTELPRHRRPVEDLRFA